MSGAGLFASVSQITGARGVPGVARRFSPRRAAALAAARTAGSRQKKTTFRGARPLRPKLEGANALRACCKRAH
eukprot:8883986-Lingulodinium_polyedra.AAC.1